MTWSRPRCSSPLATQLDASDPTGVAGLGEAGLVAASSFRSNYVVLSRQADFIAALQVGSRRWGAAWPPSQACCRALACPPAVLAARGRWLLLVQDAHAC